MSEEKGSDLKIGGLAFYLSLAALLILSVSNCIALLNLFNSELEIYTVRSLQLVASMALAFVSTMLFMPSKVLVMMHETKHAIVSGLAGNSWKGMNIEDNSGHFEYAYSKKTAHLNALIALAPYYFPLCALAGAGVGFSLFKDSGTSFVILGITCGMDFYSNIRDVSPHQSDFYALRGGFKVGLLYVAGANVFLISALLICTAVGIPGFKLMGIQLWEIVEYFVSAYVGVEV